MDTKSCKWMVLCCSLFLTVSSIAFCPHSCSNSLVTFKTVSQKANYTRSDILLIIKRCLKWEKCLMKRATLISPHVLRSDAFPNVIATLWQ